MNMLPIVLISLAIVFAAVGDVFFSRGMLATGEVRLSRLADILPLVKRVVTNPFVIIGATAMAIHLVTYITALAWIDVSVANPLTALSYVLATGYAVLFMRERVCLSRWLGVALITIGAVLIGLSA